MKFILIISSLTLFITSCNLFVKSDDLGNNFVLSEYDNVDRRILYSKDKNSGSGIEIVPMTVVEYAYNSKWIIAKTAAKGYEYWIIDKDFTTSQQKESETAIIKSHVIGPLDSVEFINSIKNKSIDLELNPVATVDDLR